MPDNFDPIQSDYDLKKIYDALELELIASMKRTLGSHTDDEHLENFDWPQWQALKLKQMKQFREQNKELIEECENKVKKETYKRIKEQFMEGARKVNKEAIEAGLLKAEDAELGGSFFRINDRKIRALSDSVLNNLEDASIATLRQANDIYRSAIYKATMMQDFGAKTLYQAVDMATKDFLARGLKTIEYKDGSLHSTADYADMAVRTATKRANLMGEGELRKRIGNPLVYVTKHGTSCSKCGKWQGRVYIDDVWSEGTAKDGKYPLLSTAIKGGLYHPRCRHGQSTYFEGINEEPEEIQESEHNQNDEYIQELQRRKQQYERLATGSLLASNIKNYSTKIQELQNQIENAKMKELTDEEKQQLTNYTRFDATKINRALRLGKVDEDIQKMIDLLDNAMRKAKPLECEMIVHRGTIIQSIKGFEKADKVSHDTIMKLKKRIITDKAFISTSKVKAEELGRNIIMKIHIPKGFKGALDIEDYAVAKYKYQKEVLLERNTEFFVRDIAFKDNKYYFDVEVVE